MPNAASTPTLGAVIGPEGNLLAMYEASSTTLAKPAVVVA